MTLTERLLRKSIFIDMSEEPVYSSDEINTYYPVVFATVSFPLMSTTILDVIADDIREDAGYGRLFDSNDSAGWYNFYISLNEYSNTNVDNAIEFIVVDEDKKDNEVLYRIPLSEDEQRMIYNILNDQLRKYGKMSCKEYLYKATEKMHEES